MICPPCAQAADADQAARRQNPDTPPTPHNCRDAGRPEGLVLRTPDRRVIAKARLGDYTRTFRQEWHRA